MSTAIAIFAKTPGLSPCKTRLATSIGAEAAEAFYRLSLNAIESLTAELAPLGYDSVWTLAEAEGVAHPFWAGKPTRYAGDGSLGARLHHTYASLLQDYDRVMLIGADAPQLAPAYFAAASDALDSNDYVAGPATDGGFTLFAGKAPIAQKIWQSTPYSVVETLDALTAQLGAHHRLAPLTDVDVHADLATLAAQMPASPNAAQAKILRWIDRHKKQM